MSLRSLLRGILRTRKMMLLIVYVYIDLKVDVPFVFFFSLTIPTAAECTVVYDRYTHVNASPVLFIPRLFFSTKRGQHPTKICA